MRILSLYISFCIIFSTINTFSAQKQPSQEINYCEKFLIQIKNNKFLICAGFGALLAYFCFKQVIRNFSKKNQSPESSSSKFIPENVNTNVVTENESGPINNTGNTKQQVTEQLIINSIDQAISLLDSYLDSYIQVAFFSSFKYDNEINNIFTLFTEKKLKHSSADLYKFCQKISGIKNTNINIAIRKNMPTFLSYLFSFLSEQIQDKSSKPDENCYQIFYFFYNQSKIYYDTQPIKNIWNQDWRNILEIMIYHNSNNEIRRAYVGIILDDHKKCYCKIKEEIKNHQDLATLRSWLWDQQDTLDKQKLFLSYCLEKKAFELFISILEHIKENDLALYKKLIENIKFELCTALFQVEEKNEKLILILTQYMGEFLHEHYKITGQSIEEDLAKHFIDTLINAKHNPCKISDIIAYADDCENHKREAKYISVVNKTSQLFFERMSPAMLEYVMKKFSELKESDFLTDFSLGINKHTGQIYPSCRVTNRDFMETVKYIAEIQFNRNIYHNKKIIMDVIPLNVALATFIAQTYPFLIAKDQEGVIRYNKITDENDKENVLSIIQLSQDFFTQEPSVDTLIDQMKNKFSDNRDIKKYDDVFYLFNFATTFLEGNSYKERALLLTHYILNKNEYILALRLIRNLICYKKRLKKSDILIDQDGVIKFFTENGTIKKDQEENIKLLIFFIRECMNIDKIDISLANLYMDYYVNDLKEVRYDHDTDEKKSFFVSILQKTDYDTVKSVLLLSIFKDKSLLKNYEVYLKTIGFTAKDFMDLKLFIFPLIEAYNHNINNKTSETESIKKAHKKLITYLLKNNINFLKKYKIYFIEGKIESDENKTINYFVIPKEILQFYIKFCKKKTLKKSTTYHCLKTLSASNKINFQQYLTIVQSYGKNTRRRDLKQLPQSKHVDGVITSLMKELENFIPDKSKLNLRKEYALELLDHLFESTEKLIVTPDLQNDKSFQIYLNHLFLKQLSTQNDYDRQKNNLLHSLLFLSSSGGNFKEIIKQCTKYITDFSTKSYTLLSLKNHKNKTPLDLEKEMYPEEKSVLGSVEFLS